MKKITYIFDFDGTIVDLKIDWKSLKNDVNDICLNYGINPTNKKLNTKIDLLKNEKVEVNSLVKRYEQNNNKVLYKAKPKTIELIETLNEFYIISNNLHSTIEIVLEDLKLSKKCKKIIGIDNVSMSKPSSESFLLIQNHLINHEVIYIGDRETDKLFSENSNIKFKYVQEI